MNVQSFHEMRVSVNHASNKARQEYAGRDTILVAVLVFLLLSWLCVCGHHLHVLHGMDEDAFDS